MSESGSPRKGVGVRSTSSVCTERLAALAIAAFNTCVRGGFMPQAKQDSNGVCSLAVAGSKLEGTGFEKVQIGHTQVALFTGVGSGGGRWNGLSARETGVGVALLDGVDNRDTCLL
jgi:hypothetical protein